MEKRTLIVDDMPEVYDRLRSKYPDSDYSPDLDDALQRIREGQYELVLTDFHLGYESPKGGLEVVRTAVERGVAKIILMSSENHKEEALKAGAHEFHFKRELFENGSK